MEQPNEMTQDDWQAVIVVMRSAPLQNMAHAEAVDKLIMKVGRHGLVPGEDGKVPSDD